VLKNIETSVENALSNEKKEYFYYLPLVYNVKVKYYKHFEAYSKSFYPGAKLIDNHTVSFTANSAYELLQTIHFM